MSIQPFNKDVEVIQKLDDEPNDVTGLTPAELKLRFDQAAIWLKDYINNTLIPALSGSSSGGGTGADNIGASVPNFSGSTVQAILTSFNNALVDRYTKGETNSYVGEQTNNLVSSVSVENSTGVITVTKKDGSKQTFDTSLEKIPASMNLVEEGSSTYLVITNQDGSTTRTDVSKLIDQYVFNDSGELDFTTGKSGSAVTVTATIRPNSIGLDRFKTEVTSELEQYNSKSAANAASAKLSAQQASNHEQESARYEQLCSESAASALQSKSSASSSATMASQSASSAAASAQSAQSNAAQALESKASAAQSAASASSASTEAQAAKNAAEQAKTAIENMSVAANTLSPGSQATVSKTVENGAVKLTYGIPKGEKGDTGMGLTILGYYGSVSDLQFYVQSPSVGDAYGIGTSAPYDIYIWSGTQWVNNGPLQGAKGDPGTEGQAATVNVGSVTTGEPGTQAAVSNVGTQNAAILNFTIPRGADGETGPQGPSGIDGKSPYQVAVEEGYAGTEAEFYAALVSLKDAPFLPLSGGELTGNVKANGHIVFFSPNTASGIYGDSDENLVFNASGTDVCKMSDGLLEFISGGQTIRGLYTPETDTDAANKRYVDTVGANAAALIRSYPIASGQTVTAGQVVDVVDGVFVGQYVPGNIKMQDIPVGSLITRTENGTPQYYLVVHQGLPSSMYDASCNGTWVLRLDIYENAAWDAGNSNVLPGADIFTTMAGMLSLFDAETQAAIKTAKIPYCVGGASSTVKSGADGLECKIFLLSIYEIGLTIESNKYFPVEGAKLSYFESGNTVSINNKRIASLNGSTAYWWLRSPRTDSAYNVWYVYSNGSYDYRNASDTTKVGIRPAFILEPTLEVDGYYEGVSNAITTSGTPSQAIALQSGSAGDIIPVIFQGVAQLDSVTQGQQITSPGVQGFGALDGWLSVFPYWMPGVKIIKGSYVGTGSGSVSLSFGRSVFMVHIGTSSNAYSATLYPPETTAYTMPNPSGTSGIINPAWGSNNQSVSWPQGIQDIQALNGTGITYQYMALYV